MNFSYQVMPRESKAYYQDKLAEAKKRMKESRCHSDTKVVAFNCPTCARAWSSTVEDLTELAKNTA
jgi:hypothetical protein